MRPVLGKLSAAVDKLVEGRAIIRAKPGERHHVMRRANHVDAIDLEQAQPPDRVSQMPHCGAPGPRAMEALRGQSQAPRFGERKCCNHLYPYYVPELKVHLILTRNRTFGIILLALSVATGQPLPQEPAPVTFQSQTRLVLLSFHATHGKNYITDLKPADVVLLEDGKPREFTIFDSPATHGRMPLELVLLFDANPKIEYFWDPAAVFRFIPQWDEGMSRAILAKENADIRISVYHCADRELYRLSNATTDARQLLGAFRRILIADSAPESYGTEIPLTLPDSRDRVDPGKFTNDYVTSPFVSAAARGWPMEAAIGALNDVAAASDKVSRVLVMFSEGIGATTTIPEDAGNHALDMGIPIYPIVTNYQNHIQRNYPRNLFRMHQFAALGKMTGGRAVEYRDIDAAALRKILDSVISDGLSQYVVGFAPQSAGAVARRHKLEIKLVSKSGRALEGGMRRATY
jgi:VWFA-related protein